MVRHAVRLVLPFAVLTLAAAMLLAFGWPARSFVVKAYLFALAGLALHRLIVWFGAGSEDSRRTPFDDAVAGRSAHRSSVQDERYASVLAEVRSAKVDPLLAHRHLRTTVRRLAADRLAHAGIKLDSDPRAPGLLGPRAWDLLRRDRPEPDGRDAKPYTDDDLTALADALDRLERL